MAVQVALIVHGESKAEGPMPGRTRREKLGEPTIRGIASREALYGCRNWVIGEA